MANVARDLLRGSVDLHIHAAPDILPRLLDDLKLAEAAREVGMGAIILKSHHMMTADRAKIAQSLFPEVKIFGGLALNRPASGGLNADAVNAAIRMGAKIIWLPTLSAANHINGIAANKPTGNLGKMSAGFSSRPVDVLDEHGAATPELKEVLALVAEADVILATGHLSVPEIKAAVNAALAAGVRKVMINHPELWLVGMGIEDQIELAAKGVMFERCSRCLISPEHAWTPRQLADEIRAVGVESTIMATDYGQMDSPPAPQGMLWYIEQMLEQGFTAEEVETMVKVNPGRMLGI